MTTPRRKRPRSDPSAGGKRAPRAATDLSLHYGQGGTRPGALAETAERYEGPAGEAAAGDPAVENPTMGGLAAGAEVLARAVKTLPGGPGVYRMLDRRGEVLYVGKARSLRKRVPAYMRVEGLPTRLKRMVAETASLEVVTTHTEVEALLLEINLIKRFRPRYNILLRDDKSFPYIMVTGDHAWPQIAKHRGAQTRKGEYFGPFASAGAVNRTLTALQRAFLLRSCSDAVFQSRTRPCLLHQIKRCAAPCVGRIGEADYEALVDDARAFLTGDSRTIQRQLSERMQAASDALDFETAARYRDRIRALAHIQAHQDINVAGLGDADVIGAWAESGQVCVQIFFFRAGQNYGNRAYFPTQSRDQEIGDVLAAFIGQFYGERPPPARILVSDPVAESELLAEALTLKAGRTVRILAPRRGSKRNLVEHARTNARDALGRRLAESATQRRLLDGVASALGLEGAPGRIEVYDNSHISGTKAVGAMIVAGPEGFVKGAYRKFNMRSRGSPTGGDDYGMMREMLERRFARALKEDPERAEGEWPDLVLIDGGRGQLSTAMAVLSDLGVDDVPVVAIAKGPDRDAGRERFFLPGREPFALPSGDPVLYYLQRLRDEAHRFAIGAHRTRRTRAIGRSLLDEVPGIGAARKRALLHHFGSAKAVANAGLDDLEAVGGISKTVARRIYEHFHTES